MEPLGRDGRFLIPDRLFVQRRGREVPLHPIRANSFAIEVVAALYSAHLQDSQTMKDEEYTMNPMIVIVDLYIRQQFACFW